MNIIIDIHMILEMKMTVKIFSQDITDDVDKRIAMTPLGHSVEEFKQICYELAEEFRRHWEDTHDLGGRTFARTRITL